MWNTKRYVCEDSLTGPDFHFYISTQCLPVMILNSMLFAYLRKKREEKLLSIIDP